MQYLKVTLQLLQNIGYIPYVVQYILEPILYPIVYTSYSLAPMLPLPRHWFPLVCLYLWMCLFFYYIHQFVVFFKFHI